MTVLKDGTILRDEEALAHWRQQGSNLWSIFHSDIVPTSTATTKREWLDEWDRFIGSKIEQGWYCEMAGVNPYWRGKVGKLALRQS